MRDRALYWITGAFGTAVVLYALLLLFSSVKPSADVIGRLNDQYLRIETADFERGVPKIIIFGNVPVIVWRRNDEQKAFAETQNQQSQWLTSETHVTGVKQPVFASDDNLVIADEWLFASPIAVDAFGCLVFPETGQFGGFFEPCRSNHYDMTGRVRKGNSLRNLTVISAAMSADGEHIHLDLTGAPRVRQP